MRFGLVALLVTACGSSPDGGGSGSDASIDAPPMTPDAPPPLKLPPVNAKFDYQLGGPYTPPAGVTVVSRLGNTTPAQGIYNICYVNGFQIPTANESFWTGSHPDLILRSGGNPVRDPQTNEMFLDISLAEKRTAISSIIGNRLVECAQNSYQAIEIGNLDSYTRSQGLLLEQQAVYLMKMYTDAAHALGRPVAQKNAPALVARKAELGTDFALVEECNRDNNCETYKTGYGDNVLVIEYRQQDFDAGCAAYPNWSIVLRDEAFVTPQDAAYVYDDC
jgi:hypothetical protein